jgi:hypothetical protein
MDAKRDRKSYDFSLKKPIWEMSDAEFHDFMQNAKTCDEVWERI